MFGGEPVKATNKEWAEEAMRLIKALDSSQHYLSYVAAAHNGPIELLLTNG